jgi:hypothetical protein
MVQLLATLALAAIASLSGVNAIPTIEAKGSKFFTSDGNQFYVKGKLSHSSDAAIGYVVNM